MPSKLIKGALSALRKEPEEKKMLQGFYRGFAGTPEKGETVYHAGAKFHDAPRPGTFTTPDKDAALKFGKTTGAKALHEFKALPRRSGSDADVIRAAKMHGVYEPGVPVGQYLEQGENAVFDASGEIVQTLRDFGYDSLRLHDAMSEVPSLVVLDPSIVRRPADTFVTPQKRVADYYAQKRAAQTGEEPHAEMVLADPFAGRAYGHSTPGTGATEPMTTKARKMGESDIVDRTQLYADGGAVLSDHTQPDMSDGGQMIADPNLYAKGGLVAAFQDGGAAFGHFPQMRPHRSGRSDIGEEMYKTAFVPQDMLDLALMAAPYGKAGKLAAAGFAALSPGEAEAGRAKTAVDLARRSLFGLKPSQDMAGRELAPVQRDMDRMRAELNRAEKAAPKVEERSVSIDPGKGSAKITDTVQKVASTPVSRRTVLKSATGQVLQNALPMQSFADLVKPVEVVKQAAQAAAPVAVAADSLVPGLMAKAVKMGLGEKEAMEFVAQNLPKGAKGVESIDVGTMHHLLEDPTRYAAQEGLPTSRIDVMREMLQQPPDAKPLQMRGALRGVKSENPDMYRDLREMATDIVEYGFEP